MLLINVKRVKFATANSYNYFSRHISCKTVNFCNFSYIIFSFFERSRPLFEVWWAPFGPRATGWEPLLYSFSLFFGSHTLRTSDWCAL